MKRKFNAHNRAIVMTVRDVLIEDDAAYLAVLPEVFARIRGLDGPVDMDILRSVRFGYMPFRLILEDYLYKLCKETTPAGDHFDIDYKMADVLGIQRPYSLTIDAMDEAIEAGCDNFQKMMEERLRAYFATHDPFVPGALEALEVLQEKGSTLLLLDFREDAQSLGYDVLQGIMERTSLGLDTVLCYGMQGFRNAGPTFFSDELPGFAPENILVCSNRDPVLEAALEYSARSNICMIGYDRGSQVECLFCGLETSQVAMADNPQNLLDRCENFLQGHMFRSFIPTKRPKPAEPLEGKVLAFPGVEAD